MTTQMIQCFEVLCEIRNFTKAAERLYISQSSLSKQLKSSSKIWRPSWTANSSTAPRPPSLSPRRVSAFRSTVIGLTGCTEI